MSLPRPHARLAVLLLGVLAVPAGAVALAAPASAHVTVASADAEPGGYGKLTFRVPNESDTASTVALRIQIPEEAAMGSLRVQPVPGWTATLTPADLPEPIEVHGQQIASYVSVVEFRAQDGTGIAPGQFQEFALSGGPLPETDRLAFPTVQTYSDGSESAWIEPTVAGQAEPERPAPVLPLPAGGTAGEAAGSAEAAPSTGGTAHEPGGRTDDPDALARFLAVLALLTAIAGVVLGARAHRRTVAS